MDPGELTPVGGTRPMADALSVALVDLTCRSPTYDARLGRELDRTGVSLDYWLAGCLQAQEEELDDLGPRRGWDIAGRLPLQFARLRKAAKTCEYLANAVRLNRLVRRGRYDVVHLQWLPLTELAPSIGRGEIRALQSGGSRVVLTVHNVLPHDSALDVEKLIPVYRTADALVCHTRSACRRLSEEMTLPAERIRVIPHGPLEIGGLQPGRRGAPEGSARPEERGQPTVLLFGFVRPYKGIDVLLEAWREVERRMPGARLEIAGSGDTKYLGRVRARIEKLELEDSVETEFRFLPEEELAERILAADVLVYPYREITQSGALLAGLATGKPVVASQLEGFEEVIRHGETGLLFSPGDHEALASALVRLLASPDERRRLAESAARDVRERFSWEQIAERTVNLYRDVTGAPGGGEPRAPTGGRSQ